MFSPLPYHLPSNESARQEKRFPVTAGDGLAHNFFSLAPVTSLVILQKRFFSLIPHRDPVNTEKKEKD
ncbi:MAG: hypothetical protein NC823_00615 [Candidatus Omnitrophica bacterium]|nr:hypothetical protein [Candidatus Omnitrophota bacterium]